jgi:hypothetical protein
MASEDQIKNIVERLSSFIAKTIEKTLSGKANYEQTQESLTEFVKTNLVIQNCSPTEQTRPVEPDDRKTSFLKRLDEVVDVYTGDSSFLDNLWEAYGEDQTILSPDELVVLVKKVADNFDSLPLDMKSSLLNTMVDRRGVACSKGELVLYSKKRQERICCRVVDVDKECRPYSYTLKLPNGKKVYASGLYITPIN